MCQVGRVAALSWRPAYPMTVDARLGKKYSLPLPAGGIVNCWSSLVGQPVFKVTERIDNDTKQHISMLCSTILRALAQEKPWLIRFKFYVIDTTWDKVHLPS